MQIQLRFQLTLSLNSESVIWKKSTTILDLQNQIYDETDISSNRQLLYFLGILLNPFQGETLLAFIEDIEALGLKPEFDLIQYSAGPNDESKWLITGKPLVKS